MFEETVGRAVVELAFKGEAQKQLEATQRRLVETEQQAQKTGQAMRSAAAGPGPAFAAPAAAPPPRLAVPVPVQAEQAEKPSAAPPRLPPLSTAQPVTPPRVNTAEAASLAWHGAGSPHAAQMPRRT